VSAGVQQEQEQSKGSTYTRQDRGDRRLDGGKLRPAVSRGEVIEPAAHLVNPPHRLVVGPQQQNGAVEDHDLPLALVVLDA